MDLQPTVWSGLQKQSRHRCIWTKLLIQRLFQTQKPKIHLSCCKTKLSTQGQRHLTGEIQRIVPGTKRPGSCLASSTGSRYQQGADKPRAKCPSGLTSWLACQISYQTRSVFLHAQQDKTLRHGGLQQERVYSQGNGKKNFKSTSPKARGWGIYGITNQEAGRSGQWGAWGKVIGKKVIVILPRYN